MQYKTNAVFWGFVVHIAIFLLYFHRCAQLFLSKFAPKKERERGFFASQNFVALFTYFKVRCQTPQETHIGFFVVFITNFSSQSVIRIGCKLSLVRSSSVCRCRLL